MARKTAYTTGAQKLQPATGPAEDRAAEKRERSGASEKEHRTEKPGRPPRDSRESPAPQAGGIASFLIRSSVSGDVTG